MKIRYSIIALLMVTIASIVSSCDPPRRCNEPKCLYTDVSTQLIPNVRDTNSILYVGDTLWLTINLPDTLITNFGKMKLQSILRRGFFGLNISSFDSVTNNNEFVNNRLIEPIYIENDMEDPNHTKTTFNRTSRKFTCYFIVDQPGFYQIELSKGRLDYKDENQKEWSTNLEFNIDAPKRIAQYAARIAANVRPEYVNSMQYIKNRYYWFEVQQ